MASLADVGWKLLEFKARSKRSGLTRYSLHDNLQCVRFAGAGVKLNVMPLIVKPLSGSFYLVDGTQAKKRSEVQMCSSGWAILGASHQVCSLTSQSDMTVHCVCMRTEIKAYGQM